MERENDKSIDEENPPFYNDGISEDEELKEISPMPMEVQDH